MALAPGYEDFLTVMSDPEEPGQRDIKRWCGGHFDPEWFDLPTVEGRPERTQAGRAPTIAPAQTETGEARSLIELCRPGTFCRDAMRRLRSRTRNCSAAEAASFSPACSC